MYSIEKPTCTLCISFSCLLKIYYYNDCLSELYCMLFFSLFIKQISIFLQKESIFLIRHCTVMKPKLCLCFGREPCQHVTRDVPLGWLTCIRASVSRSPWGHGSVAPDKRHCQQWTSWLFCGFLPNPFIQDLFLWRTSQEFVKTDLHVYPLSLISVRYAVCSIGRWSILHVHVGRCLGACQRSNCAEERRP